MAVTAPRILVVDDDLQLLRGLKVILRSAGYIAETAQTIVDAVEILDADPPDGLVLDLVLPDGDGLEVCEQVRRSSTLPILIISAVGDEREKTRAFDAGADAYLPKPFRGDELVARLRNILRPAGDGGNGPRLRIGELVVDFSECRVTLAGAEVQLAPTEFELVRALAQRHGRVVTERQLLRTAWGPEYEQETHYLRSSVARIRTKLEREPSRPRYFLTEPGVGYRLCDVREALA
jgi:two-component system, OmpR family, KDP operon response regulator KdpE